MEIEVTQTQPCFSTGGIRHNGQFKPPFHEFNERDVDMWIWNKGRFTCPTICNDARREDFVVDLLEDIIEKLIEDILELNPSLFIDGIDPCLSLVRG